jgi:hypothetical protein
MERDDWVAYLINRFGMVEIVLDETRQIELSETKIVYRTQGYDISSDRPPGTMVREP